ncbi:reverse transcriptase domain-containing protein [Aurantiacibacter spongiae]|uniref:Reverse transcriptase domain-containing protein n=1 Tax=Aurantiacibacter spongiae TaxID=2488860 RepID=A0A3N5CSN5_9SPHN|nr:reverse transcriptase domain-containing protein [Aurantiacibacter spongiae]RPF72154.1 hypothetical protein EG799_11375 [Aurantiacibacter spongiae]
MTPYRPLRTYGLVPLNHPPTDEWEPARVPIRRAKKATAKLLRRIERARDAGDRRQVRYLTDRYLRSYSVKLAATAKVNTILKGGERAKSKELIATARTIDPFRPAGEQAHVVPIKKDNGSTRLLTLFGLKRSTEQRMVQQLLCRLHRPDPRQHAMQEGEDGRNEAAKAVLNAVDGDARWFIGLDITDYYPSIDTRRLHNLIPLPRRIIDNVICPPAMDDVRVRYNGLVDVLRLAEASQSGVSQGSRTSPIVADIVIKHILDGLHCPATVINYADDFGVMARTKREVTTIAQSLVRALAHSPAGCLQLRNKVHGTARRVADGFEFLGYHFRSRRGTVICQPADKNLIKFNTKTCAYILEAEAGHAKALLRFRRYMKSWWSSFPLVRAHLDGNDMFFARHHVRELVRRRYRRTMPLAEIALEMDGENFAPLPPHTEIMRIAQTIRERRNSRIGKRPTYRTDVPWWE